MHNSKSLMPVSVLVVEDDEIDAEVVRRAFRKHKIENSILHARCGVDALDMLLGRNGHTAMRRPLFLLVDVNMPQMNGIEMLQQLRAEERLRDVVVFMLSTSQRDADIAAAYRAGAAGYFLKENVEQLAAVLGGYIGLTRFPDPALAS